MRIKFAIYSPLSGRFSPQREKTIFRASFINAHACARRNARRLKKKEVARARRKNYYPFKAKVITYIKCKCKRGARERSREGTCGFANRERSERGEALSRALAQSRRIVNHPGCAVAAAPPSSSAPTLLYIRLFPPAVLALREILSLSWSRMSKDEKRLYVCVKISFVFQGLLSELGFFFPGFYGSLR